jgi:hypothetical protein
VSLIRTRPSTSDYRKNWERVFKRLPPDDALPKTVTTEVTGLESLDELGSLGDAVPQNEPEGGGSNRA